MSRSVHKAGVPHICEFEVLTAARAAVTSLTGANFDIYLSKDGVDVAVPGTVAVTITEIANGRYSASWTDNGVGVWVLVIRPKNSAHFPASWRETFDITDYGTLGDLIVDANGRVAVGFIGGSVITSASIAPNAIGSSELATDAVTEIAVAVAAAVPTANQNADALLDRAIGGSAQTKTLRHLARRLFAIFFGKSSGMVLGLATASAKFFGLDGTTVVVDGPLDANGNRPSTPTCDDS